MLKDSEDSKERRHQFWITGEGLGEVGISWRLSRAEGGLATGYSRNRKVSKVVWGFGRKAVVTERTARCGIFHLLPGLGRSTFPH